MSTQSLADFRTQLDADETLQKLLREALAQGVDGIAKLGADHGYSFTAEEVAAAVESSELSDTELELELVAGGGSMMRPSSKQLGF